MYLDRGVRTHFGLTLDSHIPNPSSGWTGSPSPKGRNALRHRVAGDRAPVVPRRAPWPVHTFLRGLVSDSLRTRFHPTCIWAAVSGLTSDSLRTHISPTRRSGERVFLHQKDGTLVANVLRVAGLAAWSVEPLSRAHTIVADSLRTHFGLTSTPHVYGPRCPDSLRTHFGLTYPQPFERANGFSFTRRTQRSSPPCCG